MQFSGTMLPNDIESAVLVGRISLSAGPTPIVIRDGAVFDVSRSAATVSDLLEQDAPGNA